MLNVARVSAHGDGQSELVETWSFHSARNSDIKKGLVFVFLFGGGTREGAVSFWFLL